MMKFKISLLLKSMILAGFLAIFLVFGSFASAANIGEVVTFNVEQNFDVAARSQIQAQLVRTTSNLHLYIEKTWWDSQMPARQQEILTNLDNFSAEFSNNIYPKLTSAFGIEWRPGVDSDHRITLLFEAMQPGTGGYFRTADEYIKLQVPNSNEREMLYMALDHIDDTRLKAYVAHEFVHLITFNQKDRLQGVSEEVWLNEARADYAVTLLGYDDVYQSSNLARRVHDFIQKPTDSLTEWQENKYDYAAASLFAQYLVDHYGAGVLTDSMNFKSTGINSLNQALVKMGAREGFAQIFTNWIIALLVNDCKQNPHYCYVNPSLANLKIASTINFLPLSGDSSLSVTNVTKNWAGNWQKIIGGSGALKLDFSSLKGLDFAVPYVLVAKNNDYAVGWLTLDDRQAGTLSVENFGRDYNSLTIMPVLKSKLSGFENPEPTYPYTFTASVSAPAPQDDPALIKKLQAQVEDLKRQILAILAGKNPSLLPTPGQCPPFQQNLYVGVSNSTAVSCLQQFLKTQGIAIYPEGLVTGVFGSLTRAAVVRFQAAQGLPQTGYVGILTRTKINSLVTN